MARRIAHSVLAIAVFTMFGCYGQDISDGPIPIWLDSRWERLEKVTGLDFFNFVGLHEDSSGEFDFDDIDDNRHVVYKLIEPNEDTLYFERRYAAANGRILSGYGLHSDILLYWYNFSPRFDASERDDYFVYISNLVTHESDHFLGPGHNDVACDASLMTGNGMCTPRGEYVEITQEDVAQLCVFYDCPAR
jgi:hypothetical protein